MNHSPALSVLLVTPDGYHTIRNTMRFLQQQTVSRQLEVIIIAPSAAQLTLDLAETTMFQRVHVVEVGQITNMAAVKLPGIAQAIAPVVVFAEDHCFPQPEWAEALIRAHQQNWTVVGPMVTNANPGSALSWANYIHDFGRWSPPLSAGPTDSTPWHNSSYKRETLLQYGPDLAGMLSVEGLLHQDLQAQGRKLYLEPKAVVSHLNISRWWSSFKHSVVGGWLLAARRSESWPWFKRLVFAAAFFLIPVRRFPALLRQVQRIQPPHSYQVLLVLMLNLVLHSIGEGIGYLLGVRQTITWYSDFENRRERFLRTEDLGMVETLQYDSPE